MIIPLWAILAFSASILWGLSYAISGKLMQEGMTPSFLTAFCTVVTLPFYLFILMKFGNLQGNIDLLAANKKYIWLLLVESAAIITGVFLIYMSIQQKNATYSSVIEITYPVFVCFFVWLLFRDIQLNWNLALGGLMIFAGSAIVLLKSNG